MSIPPRPCRATLIVACLVAVLPACDRSDDTPGGRAAGERELVIERVAELDDAGQPILARPYTMSTDAAGRFFITDISDRDVKVYDRSGRRTLSVGRPGRGPGEFTALTSAQAYRDSLVAYDFMDTRLNVFSPDGKYARAFSLRRAGGALPFDVRVVDDSLLLVIAAVPGAADRDLLALARPDGSIVSTFFNQSHYFGKSPDLIQHSGIAADGANGVVFATVSGSDSLWAFDYRGRLLGTALVDPVEPLVTLKSLVERNGGRARRPDGSWVMHQLRRVVSVVALDSATAAVQVAVYDARHGVDLLDGGTLIVSGVGAEGQLQLLARQDLVGGLLGRDRDGSPLLLRYAGADGDRYEVARIRLVPRTLARGR
jgi:6-bladed beta-propeller